MTGIREQILVAKTAEEVNLALDRAKGFAMISKKTLRKCERTAKQRKAALASPPPKKEEVR